MSGRASLHIVVAHAPLAAVAGQRAVPLGKRSPGRNSTCSRLQPIVLIGGIEVNV